MASDTTIEPLDDNESTAEQVQTLLDIDEADNKPPAAEPVKPSEPVAETAKTRVVPEEEYELLLQKSGVIDLIEENPQLAQYITDTLRSGIGQQSGAEEMTDGSDYSGTDMSGHPQFKELEARVARAEAGSNQAAAAARIMSFGQDHPDMNDYRDDITRLVQENGMDLPTAYKYAKALVGANGATSKPRVDVAEGRGRGTQEAQGESNDVLSAASAKINDPSRRVPIGDAMDIAFEAATLAHNSATTE